ncbi:zinc finger protein with KRAB and SCAN domains 1-like isoform X34 [Pomacea canaliculata]|uniref:zinc finger protein with KRAB and SCAN domains 1-like isoform X34 n=1 Tax=Pomacea canaliculata TaxID=400727 RepID=UPI000D7252F9|nr:zinc finger protein with KRAB and SCAN domains 1-like isoform X34 [Pomacea canaliculata]
MDEESASKFINALIKSVQTLCHGYVDFNNGVEIIGYINLSVDKGSSFDYVLKEKVCKNEENSTLFISNSFHAQPKPDKPVKAKNGQVETHISQRRHSVDTSESNQLSSAISSISTVLSGSHSQEKSRSIFSAKDSPASSSSSSSHHIQSTAKRKGEDDVNHDHPPKAANLSHESSSQHFFHPESSPHVSATSSPVDSKPSMSDVAGNVGESSRRTSTVTSEEMQPHIAGTMLPQTATVTSDANSDLGVNLASSVLERIDDQSNSEMQEKDDSDLDLEVTFIKEEYVEGERSACEFQNSGGGQYGRGPDQRASTSSDSMADTPLYPVALHTSAAAATFAPGSHEMAAMAQHYSGIPSSSLGIGAGPSTSHQPGPSGMRDLTGLNWEHSSPRTRHLTLPQALTSRADYTGTWSRTASGKWQCVQCDHICHSQTGMYNHIRQSHRKAFTYVCDKCSQGFVVRDNYIGHMNKHRGVKPFSCQECGSRYFCKSHLQRHIRTKRCTQIQRPSDSGNSSFFPIP